MDEQEEFEFRLRAEKEREAQAQVQPTSKTPAFDLLMQRIQGNLDPRPYIHDMTALPSAFNEAVDKVAMDRAVNGPLGISMPDGRKLDPLALAHGIEQEVPTESPGEGKVMGTAMKLLGEAPGFLAGPPSRPAAEMGYQALNKPSGLMDIIRGRGMVPRIAGNYIRSVTGNEETRNALADALTTNTSGIRGYKPTAAEAVAAMSEGTPIQALEQRYSTSAAQLPDNGPTVSQGFSRRVKTNAGAIDALAEVRDRVTAGMRENALRGANSTSSIPGQLSDLTETIRERFLSKASALQDMGRFDTAAAEQTRRSTFTDAPIGPVGERLGLGSPAQPTPSMAAGATPRPPAKYTPYAARAEEAQQASGEMPAIIQQRQAELEDAQQRLAALIKSGASPLETGPLLQKIAGLIQAPGYRASDVVTTVLGKIGDKLQMLADKNGVIDARDLYTVRKDMGKYIEDAAGAPGAKYDRKLASGLQSDLQSAFDDAIEGAGGSGWKAYLSTYSRLSQKAQRAVDLSESKYAPAVRTTLESATAPVHDAQVNVPHVLTRTGTIANWLTNLAGSRLEKPLQGYLGDMLLNPQNGKLAAALREGVQPSDIVQINKKRQALAEALRMGTLQAAMNAGDSNGP